MLAKDTANDLAAFLRRNIEFDEGYVHYLNGFTDKKIAGAFSLEYGMVIEPAEVSKLRNSRFGKMKRGKSSKGNNLSMNMHPRTSKSADGLIELTDAIHALTNSVEKMAANQTQLKVEMAAITALVQEISLLLPADKRVRMRKYLRDALPALSQPDSVRVTAHTS